MHSSRVLLGATGSEGADLLLARTGREGHKGRSFCSHPVEYDSLIVVLSPLHQLDEREDQTDFRTTQHVRLQAYFAFRPFVRRCSRSHGALLHTWYPAALDVSVRIPCRYAARRTVAKGLQEMVRRREEHDHHAGLLRRGNCRCKSDKRRQENRNGRQNGMLRVAFAQDQPSVFSTTSTSAWSTCRSVRMPTRRASCS